MSGHSAKQDAGVSMSLSKRHDAEKAAIDGCMVPECDQPAVILLANDAAYLSPDYAERWVCRWHQRNPFPGVAS